MESAYEAAYRSLIAKRNIPYSRQQEIPVIYDNSKLQEISFRADIITVNKLIVEAKSVEGIDNRIHKTVLTYLRLSKIKFAILVNYNADLIKQGIHKKIMGELA